MDYCGASSKAAERVGSGAIRKVFCSPCSLCLRGNPIMGRNSPRSHSERREKLNHDTIREWHVLITWLGNIARHLVSEFNFGLVQANAAVGRYRSDSGTT